MTDTFDTLRPHLETYLRERGIDPRRRFRCLNPEHPDRDPSMGYDPKRQRVHCFACGVDYDLFDLLMLDEHLSTPREALALASQRYGNGSVSAIPLKRGSGKQGEGAFLERHLPLEPPPESTGAFRLAPDPPTTQRGGAAAPPLWKPLPEGEPTPQGGDSKEGESQFPAHRCGNAPHVLGMEMPPFGSGENIPLTIPAPAEDYIRRCAAHRGDTDYFARRGISEATAARFSLGYDRALDCVVLPCDGGHIVRRAVGEKRYLNEKGVPSPLFQATLLTAAPPERGPSPSGLPAGSSPEPPGGGSKGESGASAACGNVPCFVVEGVFDALSAEELGFRACAMNGSGNRTKLAALLRDLPDTAPVLLLPDNDAAGEGWASALQAEFPWLYRCPPLPKGKDLNELLCADGALAGQYLHACVEAWQAQLPPPYETTSAAGQMAAFAAYVEAQAARPPLKTGFSKLDTALDGGLYDGLYVIGAVSSLGKTAFCMQMADQLARQGRDVLIFSLEMTAFELMARSISRETFLSDTSARRRMAKTVRGVLDGRRYPHYTAQETAHLQGAMSAYQSYAGHLFFREGDHETGLDYIAGQIRRHIEETGVRPVVLIDYLQIIAPVDVHFTDKQNLDRIVCALKKLSREEQLTIFAISSFNRENYNLEVSMNAFKESGGIDYSADVLMGLQARGAGRPGFSIDEEKRKDPRELELKILKNRSAAIGEPIPLRYYPAFSCFEEP